MKDIIIGAFTNLNFNELYPWANSIDECGFSGDKFIIVHNSDFDTVKEFEKRNFKIIAFNKDEVNKRYIYESNLMIHDERFFHLWWFLSQLENKNEYRYIITTDVRDLIFQTNPSIWLEKNLNGKKIVIGTESLYIKDEPWNNSNLYRTYGPNIHHIFKDNLVFNIGAIGGTFQEMLDFFLQLFIFTRGANDRVADQSGSNVLLQSNVYRNITKFAMSQDGWCAQLGMTGMPKNVEQYKNLFVEELPIYDEKDKIFKTISGEPYALIHQYDRLPEIEKYYKEKYLRKI